MTTTRRRHFIGVLTAAIALISIVQAQCPWQREVPDLQSACICSYNLGHELSVQCDIVEWPILLDALHKYVGPTAVDLLYVNNSTIGSLKDGVFQDLEIHNAQFSGCKIKTIASGAFQGQEKYLKNLNMQDNDLTEVPVESLKNMKAMLLLDLTRNRITNVPNNAFETLTKLHTLKLSDNNVTLSTNALEGLATSLKNLNLKGTRQKEVPEAIRGMKTLAFLDLSQNSIRELPGSDGIKTFDGLTSLTALNLERNLIQTLNENAFYGVRTTLSSLSLLNNLLPDFPTEAMSALKELRVLDIGFNLLTDLPVTSFLGNPSITLLALDGNPLATIPYGALQHLNTTLRGLSLGGRFLHCDCRLAWVIDWIRNGDLQVTSRERNPQFCGSPPRFRERGFYSIQPEELTCASATNENVGVATVVSVELDDVSVAESVPAVKTSSSSSTTSSTTTVKNPTTMTTQVTSSTSTVRTTTSTTKIVPKVTKTVSVSNHTSASINKTTTNKSATASNRSTSSPAWRSNGSAAPSRPSLVMGYPNRNKVDESTEVVVKNAYRQDNSVIIQWGSETANILGFRVVYRLFGDKSFKQGPPLEASEREFKIKNVPSQECIVVCVVSLEEINVTPESVPYNQCREVRTVNTAASNMDKITIAASAAICGTIVIAVIVFIAASRRRSRKLHELHHHHHQQQQAQKLGMKSGLPIAGLPVNCCSAASPGGPLSSLATLNAFNSTKDWDQVSAYSTHSTQRPRMYSIEQPPSIIQDDMRSHFSSKGKPRSIADGQSQHSFSNHSGRYLASNAFPSNLLASRQDLRQSRQSLAVQSDRMARNMAAAAAAAGLGGPSHMMGHHGVMPQGAHSVTSSTRRSRPRSRSRDHHHRPSSRYSTAGSTHTLNNYCDNSDNWTDHDMDIYMARNPTTRNGLVPL